MRAGRRPAGLLVSRRRGLDILTREVPARHISILFRQP